MKLKLFDIVVDDNLNMRISSCDEYINQYAVHMRVGKAKFPPLDVFFDGTHYWLAHGFLRYFAAKQAKLEEIEVTVHQGTRKDATWFACGAHRDDPREDDNED